MLSRFKGEVVVPPPTRSQMQALGAIATIDQQIRAEHGFPPTGFIDKEQHTIEMPWRTFRPLSLAYEAAQRGVAAHVETGAPTTPALLAAAVRFTLPREHHVQGRARGRFFGAEPAEWRETRVKEVLALSQQIHAGVPTLCILPWTYYGGVPKQDGLQLRALRYRGEYSLRVEMSDGQSDHGIMELLSVRIPDGGGRPSIEPQLSIISGLQQITEFATQEFTRLAREEVHLALLGHDDYELGRLTVSLATAVHNLGIDIRTVTTPQQFAMTRSHMVDWLIFACEFAPEHVPGRAAVYRSLWSEDDLQRGIDLLIDKSNQQVDVDPDDDGGRSYNQEHILQVLRQQFGCDETVRARLISLDVGSNG